MSYKDKVALKIVYEGKDISIDLMPYLISFTYRDKAIGEADELSLHMRDNAHIWKWVWNPKKGDKITATISQGGNSLPCGDFDVTEVAFHGNRDNGHTCTITALGAGVLDQHRTKTSWAHEGKTLKAVAEHIASKYHYKVQGIIHNFSIGRVTMWNETELGFLHRIAEEFGYFFSLKGNTLIFTYLPEMNNAAGATTVNRLDLMGYSIKDKVVGTYVRMQNRYYHARKKLVIDNSMNSAGTGSVDVHRTHCKVDNDEQGIQRVGGRLYKKNMDQVQIDVVMPGNVYILAGNNVNTEGFFNYNGVYMISEATHTISRDGSYITSAVFKKIVPNKGGSTGATNTAGMNGPDVSAEAKIIYDTIELFITALNTHTLTGALGSQYNGRINNALASMRTKKATDLADELGQRYGSAFAIAFTDKNAAIGDGRELQATLKLYMKTK